MNDETVVALVAQALLKAGIDQGVRMWMHDDQAVFVFDPPSLVQLLGLIERGEASHE